MAVKFRHCFIKTNGSSWCVKSRTRRSVSARLNKLSAQGALSSNRIENLRLPCADFDSGASQSHRSNVVGVLASLTPSRRVSMSMFIIRTSNRCLATIHFVESCTENEWHLNAHNSAIYQRIVLIFYRVVDLRMLYLKSF